MTSFKRTQRKYVQKAGASAINCCYPALISF